MAACDAALICLSKSDVFAMTIPSKVQSCMACGIPLIASIDGETQEIIKKSGAGMYCDAEDHIGLYEIIKKMSKLQKDELDQMAENALVFFKENYEREMLLDKMDEYINQEDIPEANKNV
jgi:glycosyltransferase involved in cell wall biosynthesis